MNKSLLKTNKSNSIKNFVKAGFSETQAKAIAEAIQINMKELENIIQEQNSKQKEWFTNALKKAISEF